MGSVGKRKKGRGGERRVQGGVERREKEKRLAAFWAPLQIYSIRNSGETNLAISISLPEDLL